MGVSSWRVELPRPLAACHAPRLTPRHWRPSRGSLAVTERDPVFGEAAWSLQAGGCGEPGRRLVLPSGPLLRDQQADEEQSRGLATALLHHLAGTFPARGFLADPRYPAHYSVGPVLLDSPGCGPGLFCPPGSYDARAPTKQNLLCGGAAPRAVVGRIEQGGVPSLVSSPALHYSSHRATRYILLLQRSAGVAESWTAIHNALFG